LEGFAWPSLEHYFQAMQFSDLGLRQRILAADNPFRAQALARWRVWQRRQDWKKVRQLVMTRGLYVKCVTHEAVRQALLDTGEREIVEISQYDYFWGCGRDSRGHNTYGKLLMSLRQRFRQESQEAATSVP